MNSDTFDGLVATLVASKSSWFTETEPPVRPEVVQAAEQKIGLPLPRQFAHFATTFGAGYFGRADLNLDKPPKF